MSEEMQVKSKRLKDLKDFQFRAEQTLKLLKHDIDRCETLAGQADWELTGLNQFHTALWESYKMIQATLPNLKAAVKKVEAASERE